MHLPMNMHPPTAPQQQQQQQHQPQHQQHQPQHQQQQQPQPSSQHQHHNPQQQPHFHSQQHPGAPQQQGHPQHHHQQPHPHPSHNHFMPHHFHPQQHPAAVQQQSHPQQHHQQPNPNPNPNPHPQHPSHNHHHHHHHQTHHPSQTQPHHHQQHHPPQPQQHQMRPPQPHHHMSHPPPHSMMINQSQYPSMIYAPMNSHFSPQPGVHVGPHVAYNHVPNLNYRTDHMNLGTQPQPPTQQQPQQSTQSQQASQQQASSINPNSVPQRLTQVPPAGVSTSAASNSGVQQLTNGPMMDSHTHPRLPMNTSPYLVHHGQYINTMNHMSHIQMMPYAPYPGVHLPPHNPAILPPRLPTELGVRPPPPPLDPHNTVASVPRAAPINPAAVMALPKQVVPVPTLPSAVPSGSIKPRVRKALAIVDPETRHVFTEDELKSSPSVITSTAPEPPATSTTETPSTTTATTLKASIVTSTTLENNFPKSSSAVTTTTKNISTTPVESSSTETTGLSTPTALSTSPKSPETTNYVTPPEETKKSVDNDASVVSEMQKLTISDALNVTSVAINSNTEQELAIKNNVHEPDNHINNIAEPRDNIDTTDNADNSGDVNNAENSGDVKLESETQVDDPSSEKKQHPKLPYEAGQYSPFNPQGRKKYSIHFLRAVCTAMGLEEHISPIDLPMNDMFKPSYVNENNFYHNYREVGPMQRRSNQQMINKVPRKVIATPILQPEVELKTVENAWRPELGVEKSKAVETGELDDKRLLKVFRGHLNKLTPQKYESIIQKVNALDLSGEERLRSVIDLVFDKAVDEPSFCELYASMCKQIASKNAKFCTYLVVKCQGEFETEDLYDGLDVDNRQEAINNEIDPLKKKQLQEELYEGMRIRRKKYLGNIKLIGEMYKLNLLIPKIIGFCMRHLMSDISNENLECLCSLITTVGSKMSQESEPEIRDTLNRYLDILQKIVHSKKAQAIELESRIKFKILDTIELSKRNWKPRMVENNPKTIEEIREEAKMEEAMQHKSYGHSRNMKNDRDDRDRNRRTGAQSNSYTKSGSGSKWP